MYKTNDPKEFIRIEILFASSLKSGRRPEEELTRNPIDL